MKLSSALSFLLLLPASGAGAFVAPVRVSGSGSGSGAPFVSASRRGVVSSSSSSSSLGLTIGPGGLPASGPEEDLELTRQIIRDHMSRQIGGISDDAAADAASDTSSSSPVAAAGAGAKTYRSPPPPGNDLMIRAALGREPVERTPVWLFRQAGRHLPEYRAYKEETGRNFLEFLSNPEDVAECTLQPLRRYPVDAAILFSDILVIAEALNVEVTMPGGVGIQVPNPIKDVDDLNARIPPASEMTPQFVQDKLGHVIESVSLIRKKMEEEGMDRPLIGFSAAPWTLLFYMVGGSSKKNNEIGMDWLRDRPEESRRLLDTLTAVVVEYMSAQVEAGAHMLQLFEAMGMMIDEPNFDEFAMPCLEKIGTELKSRFPDVPLMVFARGASFANEKLSHLPYDVVTIDGTVDRLTARSTVGDRAGLQGNYDPRELIPSDDGTKTPETVRSTARKLLEELGTQRLVANLGEGLGGKESPELVMAFVEAVHEESERMIREAKAKAEAEA